MIRKRSYVVSVMLVAMLLSLLPAFPAPMTEASTAASYNPIYQAEFESYSGFQAFSGESTLEYSTEQVHNGQQSLKVSNVNPYAGIKLDLKHKYVQPGKVYRASVWIYQGDGGQLSFERLIDHKTEGWQQDAIAGWRAVNSTEDGWVQFEGEFSTENIVFDDTWGIGVTIKAQIELDQSFYVDDFTLEEQSGGIVVQTSFEFYDGFEAFGGESALEPSTEQFHNGQQSLKVSNVSRYGGVKLGLKEKFIQPEKLYRASVWVYQADGGQISFERLIDHKTNGWQQDAIAGWRAVNSTADGWVQFQGTFSTENIVFDDTWGVGVTLKAQLEPDQFFYIDDFLLEEIVVDDSSPTQSVVLDFETVDELTHFYNRTQDGAMFEQSAEQAHTNQHSMKVTNRGGRHDGPEINLDSVLNPGKTYSISAYVFQQSGQTQPMELNQNSAFLASSVNVPSGAWTKLSLDYYVAKDSGNVVNIQSWNAVDPKMFDFYVDLLEVKEVAAKPLPQPKEPIPLPIPDELPPPTKVGVNTYNEHQTINGFGTSFHWYSDMAVKHPYKDELYNYMFEDTGFNIIRLFNMYGYDDGNGGKWGMDTPLSEFWAYPLIEANREYLSNSDDLQIVIAAWSPPAYLKSNDDTIGAGKATLKKGTDGKYMYEQYADYWVDTIKAYKAAGIDPDYITLQNELDIEITTYEGMEFAPKETETMAGYDKALKAVYDAIQAAFPDSDYKIIGPESFSGDIGSTKKYTDEIDDLSMLYGISHHLYSGGTKDDGDTFVNNMRAFNKLYPDMPKMQTEFISGDPMETAKIINNFLVEEEGETYLTWDLVWNYPTGVISLENVSKTESEWENYHGYVVRDRFYAMNHFSKFIKRGYKRIDSYMNADELDLRISSYKSPDETEVVTVLINGSGENLTAQLDMNGYTFESSEVYRTSYSDEADNPHERMENIGELSEDNTVYLPKNSIATVVVKGIPGENPNIMSPAISQFFTAPDTYSPRDPVYALKGTPAIDGEFDEAVYTAAPLEVNMLVDAEEETIEGEGTAKTWLAWDDNYLYAYSEVIDSTAYPGSWDQDNLEIFLNETGIRHRDYAQADYQYRFNSNNAPVEYGSGSSQNYVGNVSYKARYKDDGSGYIIEAKLAFNFGEPHDGKLINVDVQVANDKTGNGRETIVHWADPKSSTYMDLSRLGYVFLMNEYDEAEFESLKGQLTNSESHITEYVRDGLIIGGYVEELQDQSVKRGQSVTFDAKLHTSEGTSIAYQWQQWDGDSWENIAEANLASLTLSNVSLNRNGTVYRCIITSKKDGMIHTMTTNQASLTVSNGSNNPPSTTPVEPSSPSKEPVEFTISDQRAGVVTVKVNTILDSEKGIVNGDLLELDYTPLFNLMEDQKVSTIVFDLEDIKNKIGASFTLPRHVIDRVSKDGIGIMIRTSISSFTFDTDALKEIVKQAKQKSLYFEVKTVKSEGLSEDLRKMVGNQPVYEFKISSGDTTITNVEKGKITVSIPYDIKSDENKNAITIYSLSDSNEWINVIGRYHEQTGTVQFTTNDVSKYVILSNKVSFTDVKEQDWYYDAVTFLSSRNIVNGTGNGVFEPNKELSRADFLVMLMRAFHIQPESSLDNQFSDVGDQYYSKYVATAKKYGFVTGTGGNRFNPEQAVSREEIMVMLYNVLEKTGQLPVVSVTHGIDSYEDHNMISPYARAKANVLVQLQIIQGSDNKLQPRKTATRGEAAQLIYNLLLMQ